MNASAVNNNNIVYSTNQGIYAPGVSLHPEVQAWGKDYGKGLLDYDSYFSFDASVYASRISPENPVTAVVISLRDPETGNGIFGALNDSSGSTAQADHLKSQFYKKLQEIFAKRGINGAVYAKRVEFKVVLDGAYDEKMINAIIQEALDAVDPKMTLRIKGQDRTIDIFMGKSRPVAKVGVCVMRDACSESEFTAVVDELFTMVKFDKKYGMAEFKALLAKVEVTSPLKASQAHAAVDANWAFVSENWDAVKFAFRDCVDMLPDEFEYALADTKGYYGVQMDTKTIDYLRLRNRQLFMDPGTGALNKNAFNLIVGKHLRSMNKDFIMGGGDIYNVSGLNEAIGRTLTDKYLQRFCQTMKDVAAKHGVEVRVFRMGGDEIAFEFRTKDGGKVLDIMQDFDREVNALRVVDERALAEIPESERKLLAKKGIIRANADGTFSVSELTYGDVMRDYAKVKGVVTKGSRFSAYLENEVLEVLRKDPDRVLFESLYPEASANANKLFSRTVVVVNNGDNVAVYDSGKIIEKRVYKDYRRFNIGASEGNIEAAKRVMVGDENAKFLSKRELAKGLTEEIYELPGGKKLTVTVSNYGNTVEIRTSENKLFTLGKPYDGAKKVNLKKAMAKPGFQQRIAELKAKGLKDSQIYLELIKGEVKPLDLTQAEGVLSRLKTALPDVMAKVEAGLHLTKGEEARLIGQLSRMDYAEAKSFFKVLSLNSKSLSIGGKALGSLRVLAELTGPILIAFGVGVSVYQNFDAMAYGSVEEKAAADARVLKDNTVGIIGGAGGLVTGLLVGTVGMFQGNGFWNSAKVGFEGGEETFEGYLAVAEKYTRIGEGFTMMFEGAEQAYDATYGRVYGAAAEAIGYSLAGAGSSKKDTVLFMLNPFLYTAVTNIKRHIK